MATATRDRIMEATAELFRRHGYTGTGLKQIVTAASAPFGSVYHHFPGGKEQLGAEVVRASGAMYFELFEMIMDASPDVISGVENFFAGAAETLRQTDYADACPIATVALEVAGTNEPLREATAGVFESWFEGATARFAAAGVGEERARALAISILCSLEGAFVFCRATRSTEALEVAGASAVAEVRAAVGF
jgi:AcrR family transcriptional regulator